MSSRLLTDITSAKPQINCRSWDNIVDGSLTLSNGATVTIPAGTIPVNTLAPGPVNSVIKSDGVSTSWSATPTLTSLTFGAASPTQSALNSYSSGGIVQLTVTPPGSGSTVINARFTIIGSVVHINTFQTVHGPAANGMWTLTGIPTYARPLTATNAAMPFDYVVGGTGTMKAQGHITINTDGSATPFGAYGTVSAPNPNATQYDMLQGCIVYTLV